MPERLYMLVNQDLYTLSEPEGSFPLWMRFTVLKTILSQMIRKWE